MRLSGLDSGASAQKVVALSSFFFSLYPVHKGGRLVVIGWTSLFYQRADVDAVANLFIDLL